MITDDLGAGAVSAVPASESPTAAVAAADAGADLLLFALSDGSEAAKALLRGALKRGAISDEPVVRRLVRAARRASRPARRLSAPLSGSATPRSGGCR